MTKKEKAIYEKIVEEQPYCQMCGSTSSLHIHHIKYRSQLGKTEPGNLIRLCVNCHSLAHSNKRKYQPILLEKIGGKDERVL